MDFIEEICNMLGTSKEVFIEKAVNEALQPYLDKNGQFNPRPALIFPSEYEKIVEKNTARIEGRGIKEIEPRKGFVLDETTMLGEPYYVVFSNGHLVKCPKKNIKIEE